MKNKWGVNLIFKHPLTLVYASPVRADVISLKINGEKKTGIAKSCYCLIIYVIDTQTISIYQKL